MIKLSIKQTYKSSCNNLRLLLKLVLQMMLLQLVMMMMMMMIGQYGYYQSLAKPSHTIIGYSLHFPHVCLLDIVSLNYFVEKRRQSDCASTVNDKDTKGLSFHCCLSPARQSMMLLLHQSIAQQMMIQVILLSSCCPTFPDRMLSSILIDQQKWPAVNFAFSCEAGIKDLDSGGLKKVRLCVS